MDDLREALRLRPHPEGGWFTETWRADVDVDHPDGTGSRATASAIYYSLGDGERSAWHKVASDELWLHHRGPALEVDVSGVGLDAPPAAGGVRHRLGPDVAAGERPQVLVPAGAWQRAQPAAPGRALVTCVVSPGFDERDFVLAGEVATTARVGKTAGMDEADETTQQVLESTTRLLAEAGDSSVNDQYVADDTGLPVGVVRDTLTDLGDGTLDIQVFDDGSVTVNARTA